jgi:transaldolase
MIAVFRRKGVNQAMTILHDLHALGQSVWLDFIRRSLIASGELQELMGQGVRGVTSNPSIFNKAIGGSEDYDEDLKAMLAQDPAADAVTLYEGLALKDIAAAADVLRPLWEESDAGDGFVSIEVNPKLAHDAEGTVEEARRLWSTLKRPNIMIKVPAADEGLPAIRTLISEGINVNVTLIFGQEKYRQQAEAYISGLEDRIERGGDISKLNSVASLFVSRLDTKADAALAAVGDQELQGKIAVSNAKIVYSLFEVLFVGDRWEHIARAGGRVQRPLWASTSTKNPAYPDTLYVDPLVGPHTVNTMPPQTIEATLDHGTAKVAVRDGLDAARANLAQLAMHGINLNELTDELLAEGVAQFDEAFDELLESVAAKANTLRA